ncbi:MAG: hypothetical protein GY850_28790 [bacterium]|nr:hypothetical protein [bacterium]
MKESMSINLSYPDSFGVSILAVRSAHPTQLGENSGRHAGRQASRLENMKESMPIFVVIPRFIQSIQTGGAQCAPYAAG